MAICAGVQNVSRPIERCHEISQWPPIMAEVTARTEHQIYQGIPCGEDEAVLEKVEAAAIAPLKLQL